MCSVQVSPRGIHAIFERLRHVLHESTLDKRTQYMIEVMFQVRKDGFKDNPSIAEELDLVEEDDQYTHMITLDDATGGEEVSVTKALQSDPNVDLLRFSMCSNSTGNTRLMKRNTGPLKQNCWEMTQVLDSVVAVILDYLLPLRSITFYKHYMVTHYFLISPSGVIGK